MTQTTQYYVWFTIERLDPSGKPARIRTSNTVASPDDAIIWLCTFSRDAIGEVVDFGLKPVTVEA